MIFLYILVCLIVLFIVLALVAPKKYEVNRNIEISCPTEEVFQYLKFLKNQDNWSPWKKKDPNMKQEFIGEDGTIGFISRWEGNKEVGVGEQEIKAIFENQRIDSELRFFKPWKSVCDAYFIVNKKEDYKTEVIWGFSGVNKIPNNIFMLFFNMDKAVGKDFEEGLINLKEVLEGKLY